MAQSDERKDRNEERIDADIWSVPVDCVLDRAIRKRDIGAVYSYLMLTHFGVESHQELESLKLGLEECGKDG